MDSASTQPDTTTNPPTGHRNPSRRNASTKPQDSTNLATTQPAAPGEDLTPAMRLFAEHRSKGIGASSAYRQAYPNTTAGSARASGGKLARDPRVLRYIAHLRTVGLDSAEERAIRARKALENIAYFDYSEICTEGGELLPKSKWPKGAGLVIQGTTAKTANSNGTAKIPDRIAALRTLAELSGALGQGVGSRENQPKASFVFNFGSNGVKLRRVPKVVHEVVVDQGDVANVLPVSSRMIDTERDTSEAET